MRPLTVFSVVLCLFASSAESAQRYLVATRAAARQTPLRMLRDGTEVRVHGVRSFEAVDGFAADLTPSEVAQLKASPEVRYIAPVVPRRALDMPASRKSDEGSTYALMQTLPYGVAMIDAPELWRVTRGASINVAVMDTGIDPKHPDLAANFAGGFNTFDDSSSPIDDNGHGTHVSGTIGAIDNTIGVVGVAPQVRIWSVKVLDHLGLGYDENIIAGIDWVIKKKNEIGGDWIVSLSLGEASPSAVEQEAFARVIADGILVCAAAGNRGSEAVEYPAGYLGVIAVGAVDSTRTLAGFSDHGPALDVVAPGVGVISTAPVGTIPVAAVAMQSGNTFSAATVDGSVHGDVAGPYVICGMGYPQDFPAGVQGKIAVIQRGEITFNEKVRNAQAAGATAVVIYNSDRSDFHGWTLLGIDCATDAQCPDALHPWPIVLAISNTDGQTLLQDASGTMDVGAWFDDYQTLSGTSMATPHVAGALALVWSLDPDASADRVKDALESTTVDLGAPGVDNMYGRGLIDALAAGRKLAPWRFRPSITPPSQGLVRPVP